MDGTVSHDLHHTATRTRDRPLISMIRGNARDVQIFIKRAAEEHRGDRGVIAIKRPGCARSFSDFIDASGQLDLHRPDNNQASAGLIGDDRDHHLSDRDHTEERLCGRIPRSRCNCTAIALRSRRDRGKNQPRSWLFHHRIISTIIKRRPVENQDHDRGPIKARTWPDCGSF